MMAESDTANATVTVTRPTPTLGMALVPQAIDSPVRRVVLLEDRALVERRATLHLAAQGHRLSVAGASPVLADRSLIVRATAGARVDDARLRREWRVGAREQPADASAVTEERRALLAAADVAEATTRVGVEHRDLLLKATQLFFQGLSREMPFVESFRPEWREQAGRFFSLVRAADDEILEKERSLTELKSKLAGLDLRLAALGRIDHFLATELSIDLTVLSEGEHTLTIQYAVPCAMWRPMHRAHLMNERLRFECEGAVWQATGEDWVDVELLFSTARSTQRSEPPALHDDLVKTRAKVEKKIVVAAREQAINTTGEGIGKAAGIELPGVDDGGETRLLRASTPVTIAADGRMRRIPISSFETPAALERVARPERSGFVHRQTRQTNAGAHAILAGPVELLRDGGVTGRSEVGFVAPGESFVLGFGGDDALRVKRVTSEERETGKITGRQAITRTVELFISNIGVEEASFKLEERIPVSEIEQITVAIDAKETKPPASADEHGIVRWQLSVPAYGTEKVKLVYTLQASADVQGL